MSGSLSPTEPDGRSVVLPDVLFATPREDWLTARSLPSVRMAEGLPVLYGSAQDEVDVFGSAFFMLTRYEELVVADRDRLRALPRGVLDRQPGRLPRRPDRRCVCRVALGCPAARLARTAAQAARIRGDASPMTSTIRSRRSTTGLPPSSASSQATSSGAGISGWRADGVRSLPGDRRLDPHNTFDFLMDVSERHGLHSAFYFLAHRDQRPRDGGRYLFEHPWVRSLIGHIGRRGHEVGFHPSFSTYLDAARTHRGVHAPAARRRGRGRAAGALGRQAALPALGQPGHMAQLGCGGAELRLHARILRGGGLPDRNVPPVSRVRPRPATAARPLRAAVPGHGRRADVVAVAVPRRRLRRGHGHRLRPAGATGDHSASCGTTAGCCAPSTRSAGTHRSSRR